MTNLQCIEHKTASSVNDDKIIKSVECEGHMNMERHMHKWRHSM